MASRIKLPRGLYLSWRERADHVIVFRWGMAPGLRKRGIKAVDLVDAGGRPLAKAAAIARAAELTAAMKAGAPVPAPARIVGPGRTVGDLLDAYLGAANLDAMLTAQQLLPLSDATKRSYRAWRPAIDDVFADQPVAELDHELIRQWFATIRETRGHHMASCAYGLLRLVLRWAPKDWGVAGIEWHKVKPPKPPAKLRVGGQDELACLLLAMDDPEALYARLAAEGRAVEGHHIPARPELGDALVLAIWTTQREKDIVAITEDAVFGARLRWVASKNMEGRRALDMPLLGPLADIKDETGRVIAPGRISQAIARKKARGVNVPELIVDPKLPRAYPQALLGQHFRQARALAAKFYPTLIGVGRDARGRPALPFAFEDCRDTGVTRLHRAGCSLLEICSWSNHASPKSLLEVLNSYVEYEGETADAAGAKMSAWWAASGAKV